MIDPDMRQVIYRLHTEGISARRISRLLNVSRNTVATIIAQQGKCHHQPRSDKRHIDAQLLERLYRECQGRGQRMLEKLIEEEHIEIGYSTLTRRLRELGLRLPPTSRCQRVPDVPGQEMQHDTTDYRIRLGGRLTKLIASLLYLRYCKRRYLKFYRAFNRFVMKCFLHQGLSYWGCSPYQCIIDNTSLARLRGSGKTAIIVPEMSVFADRYGFEFICHARGHANRKAGEERSFWTVETNFLPGRTFDSLEDINRQAFQWATERMEHRPQGKARIIPAKAFEHERNYLQPLPAHLPAPYLQHERGTDQYGYVAFGGNYYWVPGTGRDEVKVLQYADALKIFLRQTCLAEYALPADGVKNQRFSPPGQPAPRQQPRNRHRDAQQEDQHLRHIGASVADYLDFALKTPGMQRHRFTRELFALSRQLPVSVFRATAARAMRYRIVDLATLRRIAWLCLSQADDVLPQADLHEDFQQRPEYQAGCLTDLPDLSIYDLPGDQSEELSDPPQPPSQEPEDDDQEDD
jgi:transposase